MAKSILWPISIAAPQAKFTKNRLITLMNKTPAVWNS